ncbi:MAG: ABC transporter permease [Crenarchaeota archaeon]|nr:ABC transporter permease [Thermoproteota archaeon]
MKKTLFQSTCRITLSLVVIILLFNSEALFRSLITVSGSIVVPVKISFEGRFEAGDIANGSILITSGTVVLGNALFHVSKTSGEPSDALNHVITTQGKLYSESISLGQNYVMRLAAVYTALDANTVSVSFGYGDAYSGSTSILIPRGYGRRSLLINATGILALSGDSVTLFAEGEALIPEEREDLRNGCLTVIRKEAPNVEAVGFEFWGIWGMGGWEDDENYYVPVPQEGYVTLFAFLSPESRLAGLLSKYGTVSSSSRGVGIPMNISCRTSNISIALLEVERLKEFLESFASEERVFLSRVGFDAEKYLKEVDYAMMLLRESETAFAKGDWETGSGFFEKSIVKTENALDALSQAKSDSIAMFLFLIAFTFFVSSISGALIEKRRRIVITGVFVALIFIEILFIPQARMAIAVLNPGAISRLSSASIIVSLFTAITTLLVLGIMVLEAKGTLLSDLFWYSVKSMRKRIFRTILTIVTIAVVSAASGSLLAIGTLTTIREVAYPSEFRGISISAHVTTVTTIFRGMDQKNEILISEVFQPIPHWQVKWLSSMEGVEKKYIVAVSQILVSKEGRRTRAFLVATNASTIEGTAVSADLAETLNIEEGESIIIMGRNVLETRVNTVLEEPLKLKDGVPLDEVEGPLVVTSLAPPTEPLTVYRLLLEGDFSRDVSKRLLETSYERDSNFTVMMGAQITTQTFRSFRIGLGSGEETTCLLIVGELQQFASAPELLILIGLASLMIVTTLLGSLYERHGEYSTLSALGASPGHVSLLLLVEGLSYGLLGGALGYVLSQFLQTYISTPVTLVKPYVFSSMLASFLVAILSSLVGGIIPARKVILKVVPSRFMFRKIEEAKLFKDHAESVIPLRIVDDANYFVDYVSSLTKRPPPMLLGPIYIEVTPVKEQGGINAVEILLNYRGQRVAAYRVRLVIPENPGKTVRALAYSATGQWGIDHKFCAREMLTTLREDLLQYVDWRKQVEKEKDKAVI